MNKIAGLINSINQRALYLEGLLKRTQYTPKIYSVNFGVLPTNPTIESPIVLNKSITVGKPFLLTKVASVVTVSGLMQSGVSASLTTMALGFNSPTIGAARNRYFQFLWNISTSEQNQLSSTPLPDALMMGTNKEEYFELSAPWLIKDRVTANIKVVLASSAPVATTEPIFKGGITAFNLQFLFIGSERND